MQQAVALTIEATVTGLQDVLNPKPKLLFSLDPFLLGLQAYNMPAMLKTDQFKSHQKAVLL